MNNWRPVAAIGIDVGGTKIAGAVVLWPSGEVLYPISKATRPERGGEAVLATTIEMIRALLASTRAQNIQVQGAGVGVAELVDAHGNVTSAQTIDWQHIPVRDRLSEIYPTEIESDVRAGALAEATFGAGQGLSTFAYVAVGTGISSCFVQDGRPLT